MTRSLLLILPVALTLLLVCCKKPSGAGVPDPGPDPKDPEVSVTGVSLDRETLRLTVGGSTTLSAGIAPLYATNQNVSWSSADVAVATVDLLDGRVMAVGAGVSVITATTLDGGYKATCEVTVKAASDDDPDDPPGGDDDDPPGDGDDDDPADPGDDPDDPPGGDDGGDDDDPPGDGDDDDPADPGPPKTSGTAGPLTWALAADGTLTLGGNGAMPDYTSSTPAPWDALRGRISELVIGSGVLRIGDHAFAGCGLLLSVTAGAEVPPALGVGNFAAQFDTLYVHEDCVGAYMDDPAWGAAFFSITDGR